MSTLVPNQIQPFDDELLYSFEYRLLKENFYVNRKEFQSRVADNQVIHKDGFGYFIPLAEAMDWEDKLVEVYRKHTLYPIISIFSNWQKQEHILSVSRFGTSQSQVITPLKDEIKDLKYCPICFQEDEVFYLHKSHNLPGVKTCHKHKCKLNILPKSRTGIELANQPEYEEPDYDIDLNEIKYTEFMYELDKMALDTDVGTLRILMASALKKRGYDSIYELLNLKNDLIDIGVIGLDKQVRAMIYPSNYMSQSFMLKAIFFTFEKADALKNTLDEFESIGSKVPEHIHRALEIQNYELVSPYNKSIMEVVDRPSQTHFLITEAGLLMFIGYKENSLLTDEDKFEFMFNYASNDQYNILSQFESMTDPIKIKHNLCGRSYEITPSSFYYEDRRCPHCNNGLHIKKAKERVKTEHPDFRLIEFTSPKEMATFKHLKCGRTFEYQYNKFFRKPWCKCCKPYSDDTTSFEEEILRLTGDLYELVSEYVDAKTKVEIKHKECGHNQKYGPMQFKRGQRCPKCSKTIPTKEFIKYVEEVTGGQYKITEQISGSDFIIEDTQTGRAKRMSKKYILQELERPTESEVLPLRKTKKQIKKIHETKEAMLKTNKEKLLDHIRENYKPSQSFKGSELVLKDLTKQQITHAIRGLLDTGEIQKISFDRFIWEED